MVSDNCLPKLIWIGALTLASLSAYGAQLPPNPAFFGVWRGKAKTANMCTNKRQDSNGVEEFEIKIEKPLDIAQDMIVVAASGWGCFAEFPLNGFIFASEYWGAADDRLSFVRLNLSPDAKTLSGSFRFDLNSDSLMLEISGFQRIRDLQATKQTAAAKSIHVVSVDLKALRPLSFLKMLKEKRCDVVSISLPEPKRWISREDVLELSKHLGDTTPAAPVMSGFSSIIPKESSTVDNEVRFMIRGFHQNRYPPDIHSMFGIEKLKLTQAPIHCP